MHNQLGMLASKPLAQRAGPQSSPQYFEQRARLSSPEEAFEATFGLTLGEFYEEFASWRAEGFPTRE